MMLAVVFKKECPWFIHFYFLVCRYYIKATDMGKIEGGGIQSPADCNWPKAVIGHLGATDL